MENEMTIFNIIAHSGEGKSLCMEAISHAKAGQFDKAEKCLEDANCKLALAHECQTALIQAEAQGNEAKLTLLMVHAQDHLMNTMIMKDLALEFIDLYKTIKKTNAANKS